MQILNHISSTAIGLSKALFVLTTSFLCIPSANFKNWSQIYRAVVFLLRTIAFIMLITHSPSYFLGYMSLLERYFTVKSKY